jgi:glycosyltransferase involved in cell wall biosynthesis
MLYVPRTRAGFYGAHAFERLMRKLKHKAIRYVIVGGGGLKIPDGVNATNLGWRNDLSAAYKDVSVLARFTEHDGLSLMVLEALSYGRHVVWTRPFPFVRSANDYNSLEREICDLFAAHERGELVPQADASEFIQQHYSPTRCITALTGAWENAITGCRTGILQRWAARLRAPMPSGPSN